MPPKRNRKGKLTKDGELAKKEEELKKAIKAIRITMPESIMTKMVTEKLSQLTLESIAQIVCCAICQDLVSNPTAFKNCLHVYCTECLMKHFKSGEKYCPTCKDQVQTSRSTRPYKFLDRFLKSVNQQASKNQQSFQQKAASEAKRLSLEQKDLRTRSELEILEELSSAPRGGAANARQQLKTEPELEEDEKMKPSMAHPSMLPEQQPIHEQQWPQHMPQPSFQKQPDSMERIEQILRHDNQKLAQFAEEDSSSSNLPGDNVQLTGGSEAGHLKEDEDVMMSDEMYNNYQDNVEFLMRSKGQEPRDLQLSRSMSALPMKLTVEYQLKFGSDEYFPMIDSIEMQVHPSSPFELVARIIARRNGHPDYFKLYQFVYYPKNKEAKPVDLSLEKPMATLYEIEGLKVLHEPMTFALRYQIDRVSQDMPGLKFNPLPGENDNVY